MESALTTIKARISGRVQGVFYRMETRYAARERNITGWVRNMPDRSVEAVFQGSKQNVESIISWCRQGPPHAIVKDVQTEPFLSGETFSSFDILP